MRLLPRRTMADLEQFRSRDQSRPARLGAVPAPFRVEIRPERDRVVVVPHGDLDLATIGELGEQLDGLVGRGFAAIVLDLRRLTFIDSTGLRLVVEQAARSDATITLIDGAEPVSRLFDLTGVRPTLPFERDP
jgi:anti-sigma B factor antagonist